MKIGKQKKTQIETELQRAIALYYTRSTKKGPQEIRVNACVDMVIIRVKGLVPEHELCASRLSPDSVRQLKTWKNWLTEAAAEHIVGMVREATGAETTTFHTDMSTVTGERIMVVGIDRTF